MSKLTIARALQNRKMIGNTLGTLANRIKNSAVTDPDDKPDFKPDECLAQFTQEQFNLRQLKIQAVSASVTTMVKIGEDVPTPEAGKDVPVYQAVLIRDDLKSQKALLESLTATPLNSMRWVRSSDSEEKITRVRNFNFQETIKKIENLQDMINQIDAQIQYTDNTTSI
jgi:hypothetical protein